LNKITESEKNKDKSSKIILAKVPYSNENQALLVFAYEKTRHAGRHFGGM